MCIPARRIAYVALHFGFVLHGHNHSPVISISNKQLTLAIRFTLTACYELLFVARYLPFGTYLLTVSSASFESSSRLGGCAPLPVGKEAYPSHKPDIYVPPAANPAGKLAQAQRGDFKWAEIYAHRAAGHLQRRPRVFQKIRLFGACEFSAADFQVE